MLFWVTVSIAELMVIIALVGRIHDLKQRVEALNQRIWGLTQDLSLCRGTSQQTRQRGTPEQERGSDDTG